MQSNNFVVIQGWMCNELNLKGNDLLVFALIHGFSQDGESRFSGSRKYIAETFNISLPTVDKALQNLMHKNLIEQFKIEKNGVIFNEYRTLYPIKEFYGGSKETLPNNIVDNIDSISNNSKELLLQNFEFGKPKPKKENLYSKCVSLIYNKSTDPVIRKALIDWFNMLLEKYKGKEKVLYPNVFKGKLNMIDKYDVADWKEIIEYNIRMGYEGLYPISLNNTGIRSESGVRHVPRMTAEDYIEEEKRNTELEAKGIRVKF